MHSEHAKLQGSFCRAVQTGQNTPKHSGNGTALQTHHVACSACVHNIAACRLLYSQQIAEWGFGLQAQRRLHTCWGRTHAHPAQRSLDLLALLRPQLCRLVERLRHRIVLNPKTNPCHLEAGLADRQGDMPQQGKPATPVSTPSPDKQNLWHGCTYSQKL